MKLIVTARDPATAVSFEKLIPELLSHPDFTIRVLCQHPAYDILQSALSHLYFDLIEVDNDEFLKTLEDDFLRTQFAEFQPQAVLTGISGPDTGIDEAVLHLAQKYGIQSYALQSFWGDLNQASGAIPNTAFVLDDEASRITEQRVPQIHSIPIGSIKHVDYCQYDPLANRAQKRPGLVVFDEVLVGFYGQPILDVPGYFKTVEALTRQLANWQRPFKLMYRPHPKESKTLRNKTMALFQSAFAEKVFMDPLADIKDSLVVCDLVLSAFSTCGFDNLYLNEMSPRPFSASVYLWFEPELIDWWRDYSDLEEMPLISEELLLAVDKEDRLLEVLERGLQEETRKRLWQKAKSHLPSPQQSVRIMIDTILAKDFQSPGEIPHQA